MAAAMPWPRPPRNLRRSPFSHTVGQRKGRNIIGHIILPSTGKELIEQPPQLIQLSPNYNKDDARILHSNTKKIRLVRPPQKSSLHRHLRPLYMGPSASSSSYPLPFFALFFNLLLIGLFFPSPANSGPVSVDSITPNFIASYLRFIDNSGAFLASRNNSFQARITNTRAESRSFFFVVIHVVSHTIIWSASRNTPISQSSELRFSNRGLILYNDTGHPIWSTPQNLPSISSLHLLESGNLVLLDVMNNTVWESFNFPTDVVVSGQKLPVGKSLVSSLSDDDVSEGSYRFVVGDSDAMLQWNGMNYWKLSMDPKAFRVMNSMVEYMMMNSTGLYLIGGNGDVIIAKIILPGSNENLDNSMSFWIVKLKYNGVFSVIKINTKDGSNEEEFRAPSDNCLIPHICQNLGVCTNGGSCQCAPAFHQDSKMNNSDCVPSDGSLSLSGPCGGTSSNDTIIKYVNLMKDLDYFSNDFTDPVMKKVNLSVCQNLCSNNCSCLGIFYGQNSGSCYMIRNHLGSFLIKSKDTNRLGYVKTIVERNSSTDSSDKKSDFPVLGVVLLPSSGVILIAIIIATLILLRRRRRRKCAKTSNKSKLVRGYSSSSETDFVSIPGLPVRFEYKELESATENFSTQIGSGGFGTVYKGTLADGTIVAVKKITYLGSHRSKEFLTEIAVIGNIHYVNLVRLKGFCSQKGQRILVYEYMNRGSLDRTLFHDEEVLEWKERYEIALGTARGLAYLHTGCDHKIIHCDIKPENILLDNNSPVKITDFGLSKLLSPEQSHFFTTMRGTRGYLAPEWLASSSISEKSDVYSYGMVLLEIIRGKRNANANANPTGKGLVYFPLFALEMHEERRYLEVVDPRLVGKVSSEEVEKLVRAALCCVQEEPNLRPSMANVVGMLEGGLPLGEPRIESLNFLRFYGRRFNEVSSLEEENDELNEFVPFRPPTTTSSSSYNSLSYISSQEVSGPR